ncbi:MAG: hypothetical protein GY757_35075 [bacterium]|nr:hypothetical protein [bacterium]
MMKIFSIVSVILIGVVLLFPAVGKPGTTVDRVADLEGISLISTLPIGEDPTEMVVSGDYAYIIAADGIHVIDISNPQSPSEASIFSIAGAEFQDIKVSGNYLYSKDSNGIRVIDISSPNSPAQVGIYQGAEIFGTGKMDMVSHYIYTVDDGWSSIAVIDVSTPTNPTKITTLGGYSFLGDIVIGGRYAYIDSIWDTTIEILDISDPTSPQPAGNFQYGSKPTGRFRVSGNYMYMGYAYDLPQAHLEYFRVFDISDPANVILTGDYTIEQDDPAAAPASVFRSGKYVFVPCGRAGTRLFDISDPENLVETGIFNTSGNSLRAWINRDKIFLLDREAGLKVYSYPELANYTSPFGSFDSPQAGAEVSGSIPVSGWVLDDQGIKNIAITRDPVAGEGSGPIEIGNAVFVEGARPDIEQNHPLYPGNYKAGWGYMLLTNYLPEGNGIFTLHATATDIDGHQVTLGSKTITVDNANAVKPFGSIDTPQQGGSASGSDYVNFGWALTPQPNTIPTDGSTITVWVDGIPAGQPVYNNYREDIAERFPGYNNTDGAVGYFYLDTTAYSNGVHTIAWTVEDDAGNSDGIGSRYFTIRNSEENRVQTVQGDAQLPRKPLAQQHLLTGNLIDTVTAKKGFSDSAPMETYRTGDNGIINITLKPLERLELHLGSETKVSYGVTVTGSQAKALPTGSTLDTEKGIFYWQPGPGFHGKFTFAFILDAPKDGIGVGTVLRNTKVCRVLCEIL